MKEGNAVIALFGSGSAKEGGKLYETARELGRLLGKCGFSLCNGGYGGVMEASARGVRRVDGNVMGVALEKADWGEPNRWLTEVQYCEDMAQRTMSLIRQADACVVMPGGTGTLAELSWLLELIGKGHIQPRPVVFLGDFWMPLVELMQDESVFRQSSTCTEVDGINIMGMAARAETPEATVRFLKENVLE